MEKLKEILNNVWERYSNPLVFSFFCSWLVVNWEITLALIWYDTAQITNEGYKSIFEFIKGRININHCLWHPLIFAICYTLSMPTIKNCIQILYSWTERWGEAANMKILRTSKIPTQKYLKLKEEYDKRSAILENAIFQESSLQTNYESQKTELLQLKQNYTEVIERANDKEKQLQLLHDISIINGQWENNYTVRNGGGGSERISIEGDIYYIFDGVNQKVAGFKIRDFIYEKKTEYIYFIKELTQEQKEKRPSSEHININRLTFRDADTLVGTENEKTNIQYARVKPFPPLSDAIRPKEKSEVEA